MKTMIVMLALMMVQLSGAGQDRQWTLKECVDYALEHNISIRQSELNVQQKEIDLNSAQSRRLPGLSASSSESISLAEA